MTSRFNDDSHFPSLSNRLGPSANNFSLHNVLNSHGVTLVVEKPYETSFIGENPLVQIESEHIALETQLTSKVVAFIPGFKIGDNINITISGNEQDIEKVMIYGLLEDSTGENFLSIDVDEE
ncbi:hypothetical protein [Bacillus timonensis]|uniref:hypothetical protein n=1 Tax=Bacillus timonensis TaxID=1033734 RepID=UPI0002886823|nr:hypothetical protein [Bacillus timonensis]